MDRKYTVLLVDDEDEMRGRLAGNISKNENFTIVGTASNGYDAFEMIDKVKPDVIITDIKMPFIDGIELTRMVKDNYPLIKIAILSGYDNFNYAKEAIDLDVVSYLMKPITKTIVEEFLNKLKVILDSEIETKSKIEELEKNYEYSKPIAIQNIIRMLMINGERQYKTSDLKSFGIKTDNIEYRVVFITAEEPEVDELKSRDIHHTIRIIASNALKKIYKNYAIVFPDGIAFVIEANNGVFSKDIDSILYEVIKSIEKITKIKIVVGVSNIYSDFIDLNTAYDETQKALDSSRLLNIGQILHVDELSEKDTHSFYLSDKDLKMLETSIRVDNQIQVENKLEDLKKIMKASDENLCLQYFCINISDMLIKYARDSGVKFSNVYKGNIVEKLMSYSDIENLFVFIKNTIVKTRELNVKTKINNSEKILSKALDYIDSNYDDPNLSLELICSKIDVSVSYLSMLFKREKKINFIKYLINFRIEKAKELLKLTDEKIVNISGMCGYNEVYYFSHSFKKYTGMSPREYRAYEGN